MAQAAEKLTAASAIYAAIKSDLLRGIFPAGSRLSIKDLADRYETSVNPVREALSRLSAERIVDQREQRGFAVPVITDDDLRELVKTRCWMEDIALRESIANTDETYTLNIITAYHRLAHTQFLGSDGLPNTDWEDRHRMFHLALIANCGSSWLLSFCDHLMFQATRARYLAVTTQHHDNRLRNDEHEALMNAAIEGNADEASKLIDEHYRKTLSLVTRSY
ncbi:GntR family transcriptional regulator [Jannaschia sp. CCS1]|uniref:GntR family transcriptional regulator n=1 Tax=Jannaschia sp. (strain CCS1) TaxID=290400 RepID=UPI000053B817|nr:GntR family transcriptional regulator [Jannaschia sp. CCS1]ABD53793.1 transcriptional regulator, GntR family [Jannaschia sp. CCS1]